MSFFFGMYGEQESKGRPQCAHWGKKCPVDTFLARRRRYGHRNASSMDVELYQSFTNQTIIFATFITKYIAIRFEMWYAIQKISR